MFVIIKDFICLFTVGSDTDGAEAMVRKTADTLSRMKAVTPYCPGSCADLVLFKNVLDKVGEMIGFIKSQLWGTCLLIFFVIK